MKTLLNKTLELVRSAPITRREIAKGANVDIEWLNKFAQNRIAEPGVNRVQRVHDFLAKKIDQAAA